LHRQHVIFDPSISHVFDGLSQRCWVWHWLLSYGAKQQLRSRTYSLRLRGVFTRHGNHQGVAVGDNLGAGDAHAVNTLFQDIARLRQLILGGLFTLRYQRYARTTLKIDAKLGA